MNLITRVLNPTIYRNYYDWLAPKLSSEERKALDVIYEAANRSNGPKEQSCPDLATWELAVKKFSGMCHRAGIAYPHKSKAREVAMGLKYEIREHQFPTGFHDSHDATKG